MSSSANGEDRSDKGASGWAISTINAISQATDKAVDFVADYRSSINNRDTP